VLCSGDAAVALALRMVSCATQAGSWLGVVGVNNPKTPKPLNLEKLLFNDRIIFFFQVSYLLPIC